MRASPVLCLCIVFVSVLASVPAAFADQPFADPGIPNGEKITYTVTADGITYPMTHVTWRKSEEGREFYEVAYESLRDDLKLRLDVATMQIFYSWTRRKRTDFSFITEMTTLGNSFPVKADDITTTDLAGIAEILRGFPFEKPRYIRIRMSTTKDYCFYAKLTRELDAKTKIGVFRCYEIEFGIDGLLGAFTPKTYLWFTKVEPHFLVRFQGQMGLAGMTAMTAELESYDRGDKKY